IADSCTDVVIRGHRAKGEYPAGTIYLQHPLNNVHIELDSVDINGPIIVARHGGAHYGIIGGTGHCTDILSAQFDASGEISWATQEYEDGRIAGFSGEIEGYVVSRNVLQAGQDWINGLWISDMKVSGGSLIDYV